MNHERVTSFALRVVAVTIAIAALPGRDSSARSIQAPPAPVVASVPNLMGYWPFDELTSGLAQDFSGNANNGTHVNAPTISTSIPPMTHHGAGANQRSLQFVQSNYQSVSMTSSATLALTGSFTLAAWVYPTGPSVGHRGIIAKWDAGTGTNGYDMRLESPPVLAAGTLDAGGLDNISTTPRALTEGQWTHVAATYHSTGGILTLYVNGQPDLTVGSGIGAPTAGAAPLLIGDAQGSHRFNGNLDEVRIYNRALTATEVDLLRTGQEKPANLLATAVAGQINLTWDAPLSGTPASYSVLRGTIAGTYDTVFNDIPTTSFSDTTVTGGTTYYYAVQAVSVLASDNSNPSSALAVTGTPPTPGPPRTKIVGGEHNPCGCGIASPGAGWIGLLGAALAAAALAASSRRRLPRA